MGLGEPMIHMVLNLAPICTPSEDVLMVKGINLLWRWLGEFEPSIQARILEPFCEANRLQRVKRYLQSRRQEEQAYFRAFHQLNKQAPHLQLPLYPSPNGLPRDGQRPPIGTRFMGKAKRRLR